MKMLWTVALAATMAVASVAPANAQFGVEANGARADGRWGGELGLGYAITVAPGFRLTPAVGAFIYKGDNDRYYNDPNGGNARCRDSQTGRYADSNDCIDVGVHAYGRVEATYTFPASATIGAGARIGNEVRPYGTVAFPLGPKFQVKGNAGPDYFSAGLRFGF